MSASLAGKVVIVSGASKRLGRCYAMALGRAGATVIALARTAGDDPEEMGTLAEVEATGRSLGYDIHPLRCDVANAEEIVAAVETVATRFDGIDALVNNAVVVSGRSRPLSIRAETWEHAMRVNVRAPYLLTAECHPHMVARGGGSIVNIASLSAVPSEKGGGAHGGGVLYGTSKAALNRLTTWFSAELADDDIAVNGISPGDVSVYLRIVNGIAPDGPHAEVYTGNQLDEAFWGEPIVHLAAVRPAELTGQNVHTYTFGHTWGPRYETPPIWSPEIEQILRRDNLHRG